MATKKLRRRKNQILIRRLRFYGFALIPLIITIIFLKGDSGFINQIVLCEVAWVLKRSYGYRKTLVVETLKKLLDCRELLFENADCARLAVEAFAEGNADFSDYLIGFINRENGCDYTMTLDRNASSGVNFRQAK